MLKAVRLSKRFFRKSGEANFFYAVRETDMELTPGTVTMLTGRSGSGKTTLLQMLGGLQNPSGGQVLLDGTDLYTLDDAKLSALRAARIAVIPQVNEGVGSLTVRENILLPALISGFDRKRAEEQAAELTASLGIDHLLDAFPGELSGGEKRRMSIARALSSGADMILADEPTGDLDDENTAVVFSLLRKAASRGAAILLVTHEQQAADWADRVLTMSQGSLTFRSGD